MGVTLLFVQDPDDQLGQELEEFIGIRCACVRSPLTPIHGRDVLPFLHCGITDMAFAHAGRRVAVCVGYRTFATGLRWRQQALSARCTEFVKVRWSDQHVTRRVAERGDERRAMALVLVGSSSLHHIRPSRLRSGYLLRLSRIQVADRAHAGAPASPSKEEPAFRSFLGTRGSFRLTLAGHQHGPDISAGMGGQLGDLRQHICPLSA